MESPQLIDPRSHVLEENQFSFSILFLFLFFDIAVHSDRRTSFSLRSFKLESDISTKMTENDSATEGTKLFIKCNY